AWVLGLSPVPLLGMVDALGRGRGGYEHGRTRLACCDVKERLVGGVSSFVGLVGDDEVVAEAAETTGRVERGARVVPAAQLVAGAVELDDLIRNAGEGDEDVAAGRESAAVRGVSWTTLPQLSQRAGPIAGPDRDLVDLAGRRIEHAGAWVDRVQDGVQRPE